MTVAKYSCGRLSFYVNKRNIYFAVNENTRLAQRFYIIPTELDGRVPVKYIVQLIESNQISTLEDLANHTYPNCKWVSTNRVL